MRATGGGGEFNYLIQLFVFCLFFFKSHILNKGQISLLTSLLYETPHTTKMGGQLLVILHDILLRSRHAVFCFYLLNFYSTLKGDMIHLILFS